MPDRQGHQRQRHTPPTIRRPRVPSGERLVREQGWLTSDDLQAHWYRVIAHTDDWREVRLQVAPTPNAAPAEIVVAVKPDGYVVPQRTNVELGAEAIRIIATAIRAGQRNDE